MAENTKEKFNDLGLGTKGTAGNYRSLNKDGTFNVKKTNIPLLERFNFFHSLITMPWLNFISLIVVSYLIANILFAFIYTQIGMEHLTGIQGTSYFEHFIEAFFFSAQTITTLGYGRVAPVGTLANSIAAIESMLGLLAFALATGMLYGRFSKPSAKIKYSSNAAIGPYQDINAFMFRVVNPQANQLLEVEVTVTLSLKKIDSAMRDFFALELERSKVVFLPTMWTIVHPINDSSPLYQLTEEQVHERDVEFIIMVKAFDESFSQTVYSRSSYKASELLWGAKYVYIMEQKHGSIVIDLSRLDETTTASLN